MFPFRGYPQFAADDYPAYKSPNDFLCLAHSHKKDSPTMPKFTPLPAPMIDDINEAVKVMKNGGVIICPSDTIWGRGCDATNAEPVARGVEMKGRDAEQALICLVDNEVKIQSYVEKVPEVAWDLIQCSDEPLTVIYDGGRYLAPGVTAPDGSVAIRLTREDFSRELCRRLGRPVVSTSANLHGRPSPKRFDDIAEELKAAADYVCRSRRKEKKTTTASHIVKLGADASVKIIR